ncbi:hypothetical protein, partial [Actinophytocola sp.]|uniref:hypothetical protein n=1 Tax=Actinophytocola sp. TaxID=1872138 RepID=UPI003D6A6090
SVLVRLRLSCVETVNASLLPLTVAMVGSVRRLLAVFLCAVFGAGAPALLLRPDGERSVTPAHGGVQRHPWLAAQVGQLR